MDSVQTQTCPHGVPERKGLQQHCLFSIKKRNITNSYIPKRVWDCDYRFCYCGVSKSTVDNEGYEICSSDIMKAIKQECCWRKNQSWTQTIRCRLCNLSSIMVWYLRKVSLDFHPYNIKLDDTIISTHTCMIQKEIW